MCIKEQIRLMGKNLKAVAWERESSAGDIEKILRTSYYLKLSILLCSKVSHHKYTNNYAMI
jgi:hypothetical protein